MPRRSSVPQSPPEPIRLVFVEPRSLVGEGVSAILDREADIEVVALVSSSDEARQVVGDAAPDIVLLDASLAEPEESVATRQLRHEAPDAAFVVLGGQDEETSMVEAIELGAKGHIPEVAQPAELVATIRRVANGEDPLREEVERRPDILDRMVADLHGATERAHAGANPLTPREIDVLTLVARGLRNRAIADELGVTESTVKKHVTTAMHRLGAPNRTRAVLAALRNEWITAPTLTDSP